jgi:hypothetical protein
MATKYFIQPAIQFPTFTTIAFVTAQPMVTNGINDPPLLHSNTPVYIFIRSIRI